jgi:hypothetical protein
VSYYDSAATPSGRAVYRLFNDLPRSFREKLAQTPRSPHATADVAACLLGRDLWYPPLARFRDHLIASAERPHLWTFTFGPSLVWDAERWNALSLCGRILRSRAGSIARGFSSRVSAWSLQMEERHFNEGLQELFGSAICRVGERGATAFESLATPEELFVDLSLVEIIAHWLWMLDHRNRILADPHTTGFEVHGYAEACSICRERWGLRAREQKWVPPFHPGCRCFAQPRFT